MKVITAVQVGVAVAAAIASLAAAWLAPSDTARWLMVPTALSLACALFAVYVAAVSAASKRDEARYATALTITTAVSVALVVAVPAIVLWRRGRVGSSGGDESEAHDRDELDGEGEWKVHDWDEFDGEGESDEFVGEGESDEFVGGGGNAEALDRGLMDRFRQLLDLADVAPPPIMAFLASREGVPVHMVYE